MLSVKHCKYENISGNFLQFSEAFLIFDEAAPLTLAVSLKGCSQLEGKENHFETLLKLILEIAE